MRSHVVLWFPLALGLASACGAQEVASHCTPGQSIACVGAGGCSGGQICKDNGLGYGECQCGMTNPSDSGVTTDSGMPTDDSGGTQDSGPKDTGILMDANCVQNQMLGGVLPPQGTVPSGMSYAPYVPANAIDQNISTWWDAGGPSGSLTLTFPSKQAITSIHMAAESWPASTETYVIYGIVGNNAPTMIGMSVQMIPNNTPTVLKPISITPGSYDAIRIDATSDQSWIGINEVTLGTTACP